MDQSLLIIKTNTQALKLKCLRQKMAYLLRLFLIHFCLRRKIITPLGSLRQLYFIFYTSSEGLSYLGPKIWKSIPTESKQTSFLKSFKESIEL